MSCDDSDTLVELWIGLALFTHLFGIITFLSRAEIEVNREERDAKWNFRKARHWLGLVREFRLCVNQQPLQTTWGKKIGNFSSGPDLLLSTLSLNSFSDFGLLLVVVCR